MRTTTAAATAAAATLVLLLAHLPYGAAAPGANPQTPLSLPGTIRDISVSDNGRVLAVADDPGSTMPTATDKDPAVKTWAIWDAAGNRLGTGSADHDDCDTRLGDFCQSPANAAAISADGNVFAVGSAIADSPLDAFRGAVQVGMVGATTTVTQYLANPIVGLALDAPGTTLAVLEQIPAVAPTQTTTLVVSLYTFDGSSLTAVFTGQAVNAANARMALSPDGKRLAVGADKLYLYTRDANPPTIVSTPEGTVTAVAAGPPPSHAVLAGYASGKLALLNDAGAGIPVLTLTFPTAVTGVATNGARVLVAEQSGKARLYNLTANAASLVPTGVQATGTEALPGAAMSRDGDFLLLRGATQLHLYQAVDGNMTRLWVHKPAAAAVDIGLDKQGERAYAAVGAAVVPFVASHAVVADPVPPLSLPPKTARDVDVTFRSDGNRIEAVELAAWFPANWFVTVDKLAFSLAPGAAVTVVAHIVVGEDQPPGRQVIHLNHTLASGGTGSTQIPVDIVERDVVALDAESPANLPLQRGATGTFTVRVTNHGNVPAAVDVQSTINDPDWQVRIGPPTHFELPPDGEADFQVQLTAPANAADGEVGRLVLTLAGRPGSQLALSGVVGARAEPGIEVAGLLSLPEGTTRTLAVTVRNLGNVADVYALEVRGLAGDLPAGWSLAFEGGVAETASVEPGASASVNLLVSAPPGGSGQKTTIVLRAASLTDPAKADEHEVLLIAQPASTPTSNGTPFPSAGLAIIAVAAALLLARGRRPGP